MAPNSEVSPLKLAQLFIRYSLFPDDQQKEEHSNAFKEAIQWILGDIIIHFIIHIIGWYFVPNYFILNIIFHTILFMYDIIDLICDIAFCRDCIIWDLLDYLEGEAPYYVYNQYQSLQYSMSQYISYFRYYDYAQHEENVCAICQEEYNMDDKDNQCLIRCGHRYHEICLNQYQHSVLRCNEQPIFQCPSCRARYYPSKTSFKFNVNYYNEQNILYQQPPKCIMPARKKLIKIREYITDLWVSPSIQSLPCTQIRKYITNLLLSLFTNTSSSN